MAEHTLPGGWVNNAVRIGNTVRRNISANTDFVHRLFLHFERHGWNGAPRLLGLDEQGREILTFVEGYVAWQSPTNRVDSAESLASLARLVRQFHDMTQGTPLAGEHEIVCHNDLAPKNTVYRDNGDGLRPIALLDWDLAAPGARIDDIAHVCWQYLDLGPNVDDPAHAARQMRLICDAYGLADRTNLIAAILRWQDGCCRGIDSAAAAGDPTMVRLRDTGAAHSVRSAYHWVAAHRDTLSEALTR